MSKSKLNLGAIGEAAFVFEALKRGFEVCMPSESISPYDILVNTEQGWQRIQVKATDAPKVNRQFYEVDCSYRGSGSRRCKYTGKETDFIAAYVIPLGLFYIIPVDCISRTSICVHPRAGSSAGKYEEFRDAWEVLNAGG
jgi:hypothetical protein